MTKGTTVTERVSRFATTRELNNQRFGRRRYQLQIDGDSLTFG